MTVVKAKVSMKPPVVEPTPKVEETPVVKPTLIQKVGGVLIVIAYFMWELVALPLSFVLTPIIFLLLFVFRFGYLAMKYLYLSPLSSVFYLYSSMVCLYHHFYIQKV